jgi:predicted anti-sigma-YlaC factor YlaD
MRSIVEDEKCVRLRQALSLLIDGEAAASDVLVVASHLKGCAHCRRFAAQVVATTAQLRSVHHSTEATRKTIDYSRGARR